jgi:hypothetical protein
MGRATILVLAASVLVTALAGCSLCQGGGRGAPCCADAEETPLPVAERTNQEKTLLQLAASLQPADPSSNPASAFAYRALPPHLCQCLAAKNAPLADGLDRQRRQLEQQDANASCLSGRKSENQRAFQEAMLLYSALEIRDQAAGTALRWYYQLAGAEAKTDLLNTSLERSRDTLRRVERLKELGIPLPAPIEEYQRQLVELQLQQAQNQLTIEELNSELRVALGYSSSPPWRIVPDPGLPLGSETVVDAETAVQLGLAQRPQLLLLRSMIVNLDRDTLGSARSLLQSLNPLMAMSSPGPSCKLAAMLKVLHIQPGQDDEVERVRAQLRGYLRERERTVETEIREAVYEVRTRREVTYLAREASDRWQERIRDLEKQHRQGMPVFAELTKTYMESYKAQGEVIKAFLGWKIAAVKLKQAQGILPAECGYTECQEN